MSQLATEIYKPNTIHHIQADLNNVELDLLADIFTHYLKTHQTSELYETVQYKLSTSGYHLE